MRTRAAIVRKPYDDWEVVELELDPPQEHEVLVRWGASGLCHSDEHSREGKIKHRFPMVGGHEGAGVVEAVGPGVTSVKVGDRVACAFIPACGRCRYCSTGRQNLCNAGLNAMEGCMPDGSYRFHTDDGEDVGGVCVLGTFSERSVVLEYACVRIADDIPFEVACLVGCGVPTGWGSAVYGAQVRAGDVVAVIGTGGVGMNAVQGARYAGARAVVAIDLVSWKNDFALKHGATFATTDIDEAESYIRDLTRGEMADAAIITASMTTTELFRRAVSLTGKGATVVVTAVAEPGDSTIQMAGTPLSAWQRRIQGVLFGMCNPLYDMPRILELWRTGDIDITGLITQRYSLEQVNEGYRDMLDGKNIRGVITYGD
jgi:NDMA-dependent alcohol dehydrogenase